MKDNSWEDELLNDVLAETAAPSFRADSLDQMLVAVQRRRTRRRRIQGLLATVSLLAAVGVGLKFVHPRHNVITLTRNEPFVVHSEPLSPGMLIATQPELIPAVNTSNSSIALVEPMASMDLFEVIGDDRLLALLGDRPAALIYHGTATAELVFVNPADADGFQIH